MNTDKDMCEGHAYSFHILFQIHKVIIYDIFSSSAVFMLLLATVYSLQDNFQTSTESGEVRLVQQRRHLVEWILRQRCSHDVTNVVLRQRKETETQPSRATDSEDHNTKKF